MSKIVKYSTINNDYEYNNDYKRKGLITMSITTLKSLRRKQNFKIFTNTFFPGLDNDNIVYFQVLACTDQNPLYTPYYKYTHYFVIDNEINSDYVKLFKNYKGLHTGIIDKYENISDMEKRNSLILAEKSKENSNYHFEFNVFGIYKDEKVVKEMLDKGMNPLINHTLGIDHNKNVSDVIESMVLKKVQCDMGAKEKINSDEHIIINNVPQGEYYHKHKYYSKHSIGKVQKDLLWLSLFYELSLHNNENDTIESLLKTDDFYNKVFNRANKGVFEYNKYFPLIWKLFFTKLDLSVLNTVKKRDIILQLSKRDIIRLSNDMKKATYFSSGVISFNNSSYNIDISANSPYLIDKLNKWVLNVKNMVSESNINDQNIIEILIYSDMRNRVDIFNKNTCEGKITLDNPLLIYRPIILDKLEDYFSNNKKLNLFIDILNIIGEDYIRNKIKTSEMLLLQETVSVYGDLLGRMSTNERYVFTKELFTYAKSNDIDTSVVFSFLFELYDNIVDVDNAPIVFSENNFLEQYYYNGLSPIMFLNILGFNYLPRDYSLDDVIWDYRKLGC